ncbi:cytochrome d ubiquinol oxidase subunit II [Parageobacillus thermoglucosidasius]|uniref:cytochrome d ubiquinol oxidase subunit II n=1 Tax=Parageobacillus thermoglucosidasius TaxID=1426 RepID=UPI0001D18C4F|nr:cytochrome d ubiquinol oxidase subunit II [Parageobacillus thermoglucosidasius]AEH49123.1 cytochrome bd ubiquinol oxidase subunit II [Parageobacillus thermoglucosidasius C56-YS93]MED4902971.1 cytochrome d ubiquinol oxidase subunit II [Parageobacillus thermoglucosidasius]MED4915236.1 cytochrome d ubiquinol oxidase subunit II [Parageobacillus thermoglucosidasius]MED4946159.1 cytochrome d ubiquinol oxidase subunit II [Parageobacillus thermoglucosidasius]MED4981757.1 cytochrome d ubiquinol oxid
MTLEIIGISVLWLFLFGYVIVASIDFGAGFFSAYSDFAKKKHILHKIIQRYLSPVWEVTNVFLVFFFVGIVGFFPKTAYYYGTILLVPASIAIVLLAIRGSYYAFHTYGKTERNWYLLAYGLTGLFIPASLSIVLTISEGGFVEKSGETLTLLYKELFVSPLTWSIVLLSITSVLYISATFLTYYANEAGDMKARELLRKYALSWSGPTILSALLIIYQLRHHNPEHYNNMFNVAWMFVVSFVFFVITIYLLWKKKRYGWAFVSLVLQYAFAFYAYGISHYPYLLYPYLTIYDGFTNKTMAIALILAFIAGFLLLVPSLYLLLKLFLFNKKYVKGQL